MMRAVGVQAVNATRGLLYLRGSGIVQPRKAKPRHLARDEAAQAAAYAGYPHQLQGSSLTGHIQPSNPFRLQVKLCAASRLHFDRRVGRRD